MQISGTWDLDTPQAWACLIQKVFAFHISVDRRIWSFLRKYIGNLQLVRNRWAHPVRWSRCLRLENLFGSMITIRLATNGLNLRLWLRTQFHTFSESVQKVIVSMVQGSCYSLNSLKTYLNIFCKFMGTWKLLECEKHILETIREKKI